MNDQPPLRPCTACASLFRFGSLYQGSFRHLNKFATTYAANTISIKLKHKAIAMRAAILLSLAVIRRIIFWLEFDDIAHVLWHHLNP
jgi:hypothetical protein